MLTKKRAMDLFPAIRKANEQLEELLKGKLKGDLVAENLLNLQKEFLAYEKRLKESNDEEIPKEMQTLFEGMEESASLLSLQLERLSAIDDLFKIAGKVGVDIPGNPYSHHPKKRRL